MFGFAFVVVKLGSGVVIRVLHVDDDAKLRELGLFEQLGNIR